MKLSPSQRAVLETFAAGYGPGESWAENGATDRLAWYRHERTLDSLSRRGLIDGSEITDAGRAALRKDGAQ